MELVNQILSFLAICVAFYGINSWRKEHIGKRKIGLAEETLVLFYQAVDAIKHIRSPMAYASETSDIEKNSRETEDQFEARKQSSVVFIGIINIKSFSEKFMRPVIGLWFL